MRILGLLIALLLLTAPVHAASVLLTWQDNLPAGTSIEVWRGPAACPATLSKVTTLQGQPVSYTDNAVVGGQSYCYGLISTGSNGTSLMSNLVTVLVPLAAPASPSNLTGTATP